MDEHLPVPAPRTADLVIRVGGARWPSPAEIRAELPEDARAEFEREFAGALDHAHGTGQLAALADVLAGWQRHLILRRTGDYERVVERSARLHAGERLETVPAAQTRRA
ncbi:DUF6247 family protein [Embleya sp. NPDC050154]|uniref:DUF6247 family protein n=1 Tax=Embleya sp. NPDC050154 TaxID=3363988 RepID=UPI0037B59865